MAFLFVCLFLQSPLPSSHVAMDVDSDELIAKLLSEEDKQEMDQLTLGKINHTDCVA